MLLSCYILDDESAARKRMEYLIKQFLKDDLNLLGQHHDPEQAAEEVLKLAPDILFLDIEMPGMSGLDFAAKIKAEGFKGHIIFISVYGHYAIRAIRTHAIDYLLKPIDVDELKEAVHRVTSQIDNPFNADIIHRFDLSEREIELVEQLAKGFSSEEIADRMFLSKHTVDTHRRNIHSKTGTRNSIELLNLLKNE